MEPQDSRTRHISNNEITFKIKIRDRDRLVGVNYQSVTDCKGQTYNRVHRTLTVYDKNDNPVITDICNYRNAWPLRRLTEEFIGTHVSLDLEIYEHIMTEKED